MAAVSRAHRAPRYVWLLLVAAAGASAQQSPAPIDPVIQHFRDYRAALDRDDLPAAETAAAAALAASEAANGPRTAVLALNLANLRLELGPPNDALTPARTAHTLATTSAESGIDPAAAALTLGRAEVAAGDAAGAPRLLAAFAAAESNAALETDVYNAAVVLGTAAIDANDYDSARSAWSTAARLAHATDDPELSRARALTGEGASIFLASFARAVPGPTGQIRVLSRPDAQAASDAFATAQRLLLPIAFADASGGTLTTGQLAYAQAMAWQSALLAKVESDGEAPPQPPTFGRDMPTFDNDDWCSVRTIRRAEVEYPPEALNRYGVGAVVLHMGLDAAGTVTSRTIAASIPPGVLADAVEKAADEWHVEKNPSSPAGCRMPSSTYVNVRFLLD
jgi:hypothetical protein